MDDFVQGLLNLAIAIATGVLVLIIAVFGSSLILMVIGWFASGMDRLEGKDKERY